MALFLLFLISFFFWHSIIPSVFFIQNYISIRFYFLLWTQVTMYIGNSRFLNTSILSVSVGVFFPTTENVGLLNLVQYYFIDRVIFIYNFKGINFPNLIHSSIIICWYLHMISLWLVIFKYLIMGELNVFQNSLWLK